MNLELNAYALENLLDGKLEKSFFVKNIKKSFPAGDIKKLKPSEGGSLVEKKDRFKQGFGFFNKTNETYGHIDNAYIKKTNQKVKLFVRLDNENEGSELKSFATQRHPDHIQHERKVKEEAIAEFKANQKAKLEVQEVASVE